jgi:hypothetical protein
MYVNSPGQSPNVRVCGSGQARQMGHADNTDTDSSALQLYLSLFEECVVFAE